MGSEIAGEGGRGRGRVQKDEEGRRENKRAHKAASWPSTMARLAYLAYVADALFRPDQALTLRRSLPHSFCPCMHQE